MTKKDDKEENFKNHIKDNDLCGLSCYRKTDFLSNNNKKDYIDENIVKGKNTYLTYEESINSRETFKILKDLKQQSYHKPSFAPPIQNQKIQIQQWPRFCINFLNYLDRTPKKSTSPSILQRDSNISKNKKILFNNKIFDHTSSSKIHKEVNKITSKSKQNMFHNILYHKNCKLSYNGHTISPKLIENQYKNIPISAHESHQCNSFSSLQSRTLHNEFHIERCKSRSKT